MPEVSAYKMKCLITIWENHLLLKKLCGQGESVYEFQNSKSLLDAAVALETGRLPTPTPPGSTASESSDGDIKEREVQNPRHRSEVAGEAAAEASNVDAIGVDDFTNLVADSKPRLLRTRKNVAVVAKQTSGSSKEDGDTAAESDNDYVEGCTSGSLSCETKEEESEEDDETEFEDSDTKSADNDEDEHDKTILSNLVLVSEDRNCVLKNPQTKTTLPKQLEEEGGATTVTTGHEVSLSMDVSKEREHQKQGFETWSMGKKSRRKATSTKKVVSKNTTTVVDLLALDVRVPEHEVPKVLAKFNRRREEANVGKVKSRSGKIIEGPSEGTMNISKEDYRLLMSIKGKSIAAKEAASKDDIHSTSKIGFGSRGPKEGVSSLIDIDERQKRRVGPAIACGEELQSELQRRTRRGGEKFVQSDGSPVAGFVSEDGIRGKGKRKQLESSEAEECDAGDSDFKEPPKKRSGMVHTGGPLLNQRCAHVTSITVGEKNAPLHSSFRPEQDIDENRNGTYRESFPVEQREVGLCDTRVQGGRLQNDKTEDRSLERLKVPQKKKKMAFAFEKSGEDNALQLVPLEGSTEVVPLSDDDDDFQEFPSHDRLQNDVLQKSRLTESEGRTIRKRRKAERDLAMRKRESSGAKPFYIMVNAMRIPYGDGLTAWRAEVNKLSRGLDPSIRDIRQQPHKKIEILKRRLMDKFDYSAVISDKFLLPLAGQRVLARRNELMNLIRADKDRPSGMDEDIWRRLQSISESSNFQRKSAAMQYANACRHSLGRTGPGGERRVRESLKNVLHRSPDPEEVQAEMTRDKGYGGKKRKVKRMLVRVKMGSENADSDEEDNMKKSEDLQVEDLAATELKDGMTNRGEEVKETSSEQMKLIKQLLQQVEELKARVESGVPQPSPPNVEPALHSMTVTAPTSSCQEVSDQGLSVKRKSGGQNL